MNIKQFFSQHNDVECHCNKFQDIETCCETLKERLNDCRIGIRYDKQYGDYAIKQRYMSGYNSISHCPWCGSKFPVSLEEN